MARLQPRDPNADNTVSNRPPMSAPAALPHAAQPAADAAALPERIGKYRVQKRLGEGATSEVFLAEDEFHQRQVAIKRARSAASQSGDDLHYRERFFAAEADLVGKLQHPNVVQIYDAVADPTQPYLVMEYVPGVTLRRFCRADTLLSLEQVVEIGFKCAMALGYVARKGDRKSVV